MKNNSIVKNITNSPIVIILISFFFLGGILYTTWNQEPITINAFLNIIISLNYLTVFIFPVFYIFTAITYKKINNPIFINRFPTRKKYLKFVITVSLKSLAIVFVYYILVMLICFNMMGVSDYTIEKVSFATNLFFLVSKLVKLFFFLIVLQLFSIASYFAFKNSTISGIMNIFMFLLIYLLKYVAIGNNFLLKSLNPAVHLTQYDMNFSNYGMYFLSTLIFFIFYFTVIIVGLKLVIRKKEFLEKE